VVKSSVEADKPVPIPMVLACESFQGLACPHVVIDNVAAARVAVEHLVAVGRRRIATITGPLVNAVRRPASGYREVLAQAGLSAPQDWVREGDFPSNRAMAPCMLLIWPSGPTRCLRQ
jgi:LacI family repressor for deo operon, udp, cdd, tsx, nupC, and nupG